MRRDQATNRIIELLARVTGGGNLYLDAVEEVSVFGSYAAGALVPNDVDLLIIYYDVTGQISKEQISRMFAGKSVETPFAQALRGRRRGLNIVFNVRQQLERQGGFEFVTLWRRGDALNVAVERLQAIAEDAAAGTAPRDAVHAAISGYEKHTLIESRQRLIDLDTDGSVRVRRFEIGRGLEPLDPELHRRAGWGYSETSPRRRATRALLAHLEAQGHRMEGSHKGVLLSRDLSDRPFATVQHGGERLGPALDDALYGDVGLSYCVLNLTGHAPLAILEIKAVTPSS